MSSQMTERKIILVKRKTRLEELIVRYNTIQQARFFMERLGADFSDYVLEDENYRRAVTTATSELTALGRVQIVEREHVPNFIFGEQDTIVVLGQDGLVANTLKYLNEQPLIGVNPDPLRWDGVLLPFTVSDLHWVVSDVFVHKRPIKEVTLAKAQLNDGQSLYAVNDLFIGRKTHVSARYELRLEDQVEQQSSSGIIVSTGLGTTGWLTSVLAGAAGIVGSATRHPISLTPDHLVPGAASGQEAAIERMNHDHRAVWSSPSLYFTVREPFPSRTTAAELVFGQIAAQRPLRIASQMPENGVIFSDGVESDFLEFNVGIEATIGPAEKKGHLVV
ncbi:sugar kinase [Paenibacillus kribbensis]|uniref:Sugar kinase n=1 Tax=Paenibacillus kribbensis TaxID=172713 RepID=A0A222WRU7_9BACL|nr:sugar kinase [Paenibacillus kribbensis]ASR48461.1 sugar kinase [Paenibacillus kribbensis]